MWKSMLLIDEKELRQLIADSFRLQALEASGVDNWTWYGENFQEVIEAEADLLGIEYNEDMGFDDIAEHYVNHYYEETKVEIEEDNEELFKQEYLCKWIGEENELNSNDRD